MDVLFANSGDPDQMPHSASSDLGLHCLSITLLGISRLQWVKEGSRGINNNSVNNHVCSLPHNIYVATYLFVMIDKFHHDVTFVCAYVRFPWEVIIWFL